MQSIKNDFNAGLNLDDSPYKIQPNAYVDALNITQDAVEGSNDMVVSNIVGNRLVDYSLPSGVNKVIGAIANTVRNTVIYMVYNSNDFDSILEYNNTSRTIIKLLENITDTGGEDVLGFTENNKITSINIYPRDLDGDLCFFIDSLGRPTGFNIESFRNNVYPIVTRSIIDVAKEPPLSPPTSIYNNDTSVRSNNIRKRLFRFKYRYVYDDFEKSTFSPISSIPLPVNILNETFTSVITNNNVITLSVLNGAINVSKIEIGMSFSQASNEWSDFALIQTIDAKDYQPGESIAYNFYNDGVYPTIDISESIQIYDYVPQKANAQEMPNGNVLMYGGITEGYDKDLVPNVEVNINIVPAGGGNPTGSLSVVITTVVFVKAVFSGTPATGTIVNIKVKNTGTGIISTAITYTTVLGDSSASVATQLASMSGVGIAIITNPNPSDIRIVMDDGYEFETIEILPPVISSQSNSISTYPFSIGRRIGIVYFDQKGRTNGVLYNTQIIFPAYAEDGSQAVLLPYINTKIFHIPPIWAYSYQWVMTKDNTGYIYWCSVDVNTTESGFLYFDVSNFSLNQKKFPTTTQVLSYTFQDGDRMRLIKRDSDNVVFNDTYDASIEGQVVDPIINGVQKTGTFIKIKNVAPFNSVNYTSKTFIIQLYRPAQQNAGGEAKQQVYYEFAQEFSILNPTTINRVHAGGITDQNIIGGIPAESDFYNGDAYFRLRNVVLTESSSGGLTGSASFNVLDRNFVDFYLSGVNDIDGRPSIIDENARMAYYSTLVRFGQAYQANTNINGLNRFFPNNFDEYDVGYGDIMRIVARDRFLRIFQKLKVGMVPIFNQISKNADGAQLLVVTDKLLNPIQYYSGNYGIGDHPESLTSFNFADYFMTNIQGGVIRVSNDGISNLSVLYKINSWSTANITLRDNSSKIYGAFDQRLNKYIGVLEVAGDSPEQTISFKEDKNNFDSFLSYYPEMMVTLGTLFIGFKNGQLWTHDSSIYNNFFGIQYESSITPVFNQASAAVKSFMALEEKSNNVWECPIIETSLMSYGTTPQQSNLISEDFSLLEGKYCAAFLRDTNSIGGINGGDQLKGDWIKIKMDNNNSSNIVTLNLVSVRMIDSPLNNR